MQRCKARWTKSDRGCAWEKYYDQNVRDISLVLKKKQIHVNDLHDESNEDVAINLLNARGVEIKVISQGDIDENNNTTLGITLSTTDRESITLKAGKPRRMRIQLN